LRDTAIDELLEELADFDSSDPDAIKDFSDLCGDAERALFLFQTLIENEFGRQAKHQSDTRPLASRLTVQHRMHPTIAGIVTAAFYPDLSTDSAAVSRYSGPPPVASTDPARLPDVPVIWIDMPSLQHTPQMTIGERYPRYHNPDEVAAVLTVLSLIGVTADSRPSLAVLSPYTEQIRRLTTAIDSSRTTKLSSLDRFRTESKEGRLCHTVDSFQGSEADIVVISLVRNNQHGGLRAIGFLSDARRMNVLLSRARWRLVIVGSMQFLKEIAHQRLNVEDSARLQFLRDVLGHIQTQSAAGHMAIVPLQTLRGTGVKK
jgi:hypothetical protein